METPGNEQQIAEKCAWDAMQQQALSPKASDIKQSFGVYGTSGDTLDDMTAGLLISQGFTTTTDIRSPTRNPVVLSAVREVFYTAQHLGLIVPGRLGQDLDYNSHYGAYQFTTRGLAFFRNGEISLSAPGLLIERVREVTAGGTLDPGIVPLVEEAQRCWAMGCLRASMVMIGLASEEVCTGLLDELCKYPSPPSKGDKLYPDWEKLNNEALSFYTRWQSGLALLESVKLGLRKAHGASRPDWWRIWEPLPGAIQPYAEAVRIARNTAAHSVDDIFTPAQVGLMLASLPTMLEVIAELKEFLQTPPNGIQLPSLV